MTWHVYAFGSVCRSDFERRSDIDMLAITDTASERFDPLDFSVYPYEAIRKMWKQGSPFAWHLATESRLVYAGDQQCFLSSLGQPSAYLEAKKDCEAFRLIASDATSRLVSGSSSDAFELSLMYLSARNFATCYALGCLGKHFFGPSSAYKLGVKSLPLGVKYYETLRRCRLLSTRGIGSIVEGQELRDCIDRLQIITDWMSTLSGDIDE